jgi:hypothetical protein
MTSQSIPIPSQEDVFRDKLAEIESLLCDRLDEIVADVVFDYLPKLDGERLNVFVAGVGSVLARVVAESFHKQCTKALVAYEQANENNEHAWLTKRADRKVIENKWPQLVAAGFHTTIIRQAHDLKRRSKTSQPSQQKLVPAWQSPPRFHPALAPGLAAVVLAAFAAFVAKDRFRWDPNGTGSGEPALAECHQPETHAESSPDESNPSEEVTGPDVAKGEWLVWSALRNDKYRIKPLIKPLSLTDPDESENRCRNNARPENGNSGTGNGNSGTGNGNSGTGNGNSGTAIANGGGPSGSATLDSKYASKIDVADEFERGANFGYIAQESIPTNSPWQSLLDRKIEQIRNLQDELKSMGVSTKIEFEDLEKMEFSIRPMKVQKAQQSTSYCYCFAEETPEAEEFFLRLRGELSVSAATGAPGDSTNPPPTPPETDQDSSANSASTTEPSQERGQGDE